MTMPNQLGQIALSEREGIRGKRRERERVNQIQRVREGWWKDDIHRDVSRKKLGLERCVHTFKYVRYRYLCELRSRGLLSLSAIFLLVSQCNRDESYMHERRTFLVFSSILLFHSSSLFFLFWSRYTFSEPFDLLLLFQRKDS